MKTKRYSTEQIIGILKEAEAGLPVKELCRKHGVSDARRLRELETENQRLKPLVAEQALDNQILKELVSKNRNARSCIR